MIADLHDRELSQHRWGAKAARLALAARHGIPVPQGICLHLAHDGASATQRRVLASWLATHRPAAVIVRSSSADEDTAASSAAGRFLTERDVPPAADAVMDSVMRVRESLMQEASTRSVIIQHQLPAELAGVTFTSDDGTFLTEGSPIPAAVTDGQPPAFRLDCRAESFTLDGQLDTVPPVRLARDLRHLVGQLRQIFPFDLDIEWATAAGYPFLLQVRPVTAPMAGTT